MRDIKSIRSDIRSKGIGDSSRQEMERAFRTRLENTATPGRRYRAFVELAEEIFERSLEYEGTMSVQQIRQQMWNTNWDREAREYLITEGVSDELINAELIHEIVNDALHRIDPMLQNPDIRHEH